MKRIGLTQRVEVAAPHGERRDCLDQRWSALLRRLGYLAIPLPNQPELAVPLTRGLTGVVLTGGNDLAALGGDAPERDALEARLVELGIPLLGVCRGAQLLAFHYGSALERRSGHAGTRHPLRAHDWASPFAEVNSYHGWAVTALGGPLQAAAWAPDETIEAFRHSTLPQFGVLWHPERETCPADEHLLKEIFR